MRHHFVIVGKDLVEGHREWGAKCIPVELVEEIRLLLPREQVVRTIGEVEALGRRIGPGSTGGGRLGMLGYLRRLIGRGARTVTAVPRREL